MLFFGGGGALWLFGELCLLLFFVGLSFFRLL